MSGSERDPLDAVPVVITGGSRGIGAASVLRLAAEGRPVAFSYLSDTAAAKALEERVREAGGTALAVQGDAAEENAVAALFDACTERFGPPTGVFANAGITGPATRLEGLQYKDLRRVLDVNVTGTFLVAREAIRAMSINHGGRGGSLVLMSSRAARLGGAGEWVHYAASKGAIDTMTVGLARELGGDGIRVNAVAPGLIATDIHAAAGLGDRLKSKAAEVPLGRSGEAGEVADVVAWLMTSSASYVSGTVIDISGGR